MKLDITPYHYETLIKQSISLDQIYLLTLIQNEYDIAPMMKESLRLGAILASLIRKGYVDPTTEKITTTGEELLLFLGSPEMTKLARKVVKTEEFDEWWKAFPGTDNFVHNGKKFKGSRGLKRSIDDCRVKFNKILAEGNYSARELIDAMKLDVEMKKDKSVTTGENRLSFLQNSLTYLNQRSFEPFIELLKDTQLSTNKIITGGTDI